MSEHKERIYELNARHLSKAKVELWRMIGVDLVIGQRAGYRMVDVDGHELIDLHLNGGTYNLGHNHPELVGALRAGLDEGLDIGNHHFASEARGELAARLAELSPGDLNRVVFAGGGGEAGDIAIKSARRATGRRRIVSAELGYHGHTGLTLAAGAERYSKPFLSDGDPAVFTRVPFDDLDALERALAESDVAAVILETIPATAGFLLPSPGYLNGVRQLCDRFGTLYIADEVQTGLGRTGHLWGVTSYDVVPDMLITAKGLSGGLYPMAATVLSDRCGAWLSQDSHGHVSTFGGAELGCRVALKVLEITTREATVQNAKRTAARLEAGLSDIRERHPFLREVRQRGLVIGLSFASHDGGIHVMRALYEAGVWAIAAGFDYGALQVKPGLLFDEASTDEVLDRLDTVIGRLGRGR